ncbi:pyridoxal phosphate-dependent protein [Methanobacterium sp. MZ-A1]|uniref:TIGR03576 family pyridoxal phosphate-dependent enzyme n=2 Tax=Methanobacterium subterraneum TaxID=59277 RepID=A0A7K4DP70_9EURY|nr:TIGR03576 family pyridoxal phosphate-dependent enzyme [Methanobacterium sp. MZ-A1]AUB56926.1 pyridoxal phosphate-dependent protein [Methanobacterium sp. MZ-A1]MBW4257791.1 TIGR03576 family pyridoxal phosphate-dependent enzyme [Methanobacterium sp. YSL]NMO10210.1 TIGR03576 family pyridoxal phosphate-dependent enzyme [Methanobacterium subterraneum]
MLICSSRDEMKRREAALRFIAALLNQEGRSSLYDLSGLAGGFPVKKSDLNLLETYSGPAIFSSNLQKEGTQHLGGEKVAAFNRTSAAILATMLALVKPGEEVIHYLPELPSHPSIPRSVKLQGASYREFDNLQDFQLTDETSLVIITGSTMDHKVLPLTDFNRIIQISHAKQIPVMVDDASGARIRTVIYDQPRALDMGADLVVTSTDKLMDGPRAGLMAGNSSLIDRIQDKAHQFGLEAQPPIVAGIVRALENFKPQRILDSLERRDELHKIAGNVFKGVEKTPTGFMISAANLENEITPEGNDNLTKRELATLMAMVLLREHHMVTIPAVGMPGVSDTIRLDISSKDAERVDDNQIIQALKESLEVVREIIPDEEASLSVLYE